MSVALPVTPCIWLDKRRIIAGMQPCYQQHTIHIFTELPSTNDYLKRMARSVTFDQHYPADKVLICLSECQTAGRGQWQRPWHSPMGENIYLSLLWQSTQSVDQLTGLSLCLGEAIVIALTQLGVSGSWQLKHPNDVLWDGKKLAGILVETIVSHAQPCRVIIGMGINVNMQVAQTIEQPWTSLQQITQRYWDRNQVVARLLNQVLAVL